MYDRVHHRLSPFTMPFALDIIYCPRTEATFFVRRRVLFWSLLILSMDRPIFLVFIIFFSFLPFIGVLIGVGESGTINNEEGAGVGWTGAGVEVTRPDGAVVGR